MRIPERVNWSSFLILLIGSFAVAFGGIRLGLESLVLSLSFSLTIICLYQIYKIRKVDERSIVRYTYDPNGRLIGISLHVVDPDRSIIETFHDGDGYLAKVGIRKSLSGRETLAGTFAATLKTNQPEVDDLILRYRDSSSDMVADISGIAGTHERQRVKYTKERFADRMKKKRLRRLR
jgi:YD repeat-containing protein